MEFEELLTPEELANILRVSEITIRVWLRKGTLPGLKIGGLWRIKAADLRALIEKGKK